MHLSEKCIFRRYYPSSLSSTYWTIYVTNQKIFGKVAKHICLAQWSILFSLSIDVFETWEPINWFILMKEKQKFGKLLFRIKLCWPNFSNLFSGGNYFSPPNISKINYNVPMCAHVCRHFYKRSNRMKGNINLYKSCISTS